MQEIIKLLKALYDQLNDQYDDFLESQFWENAGLNADFFNWTEKNCINFYDWSLEQESGLMDEILDVLNVLFQQVI